MKNKWHHAYTTKDMTDFIKDRTDGRRLPTTRTDKPYKFCYRYSI